MSVSKACDHVAYLVVGGSAMVYGSNRHLQCAVPLLPNHLRYVQVSTGNGFTVFLRSDGIVLSSGCVPPGFPNGESLPLGLRWRQVSCGPEFVALLRSDGVLFTYGGEAYGMPAHFRSGTSEVIVQVAAGTHHVVILTSAGIVMGIGQNQAGQLDIPVDVTHEEVVFVEAGRHTSFMLCRSGSVLACGLNDCRQCELPRLTGGLSYVGISAGCSHVVGLVSDGSLRGAGQGSFGCLGFLADRSPLRNVSLVSAGIDCTHVCTQDGDVLAFGNNSCGQLTSPLDTAGLPVWVSPFLSPAVSFKFEYSIRRGSMVVARLLDHDDGVTHCVVEVSKQDAGSILQHLHSHLQLGAKRLNIHFQGRYMSTKFRWSDLPRDVGV